MCWGELYHDKDGAAWRIKSWQIGYPDLDGLEVAAKECTALIREQLAAIVEANRVKAAAAATQEAIYRAKAAAAEALGLTKFTETFD